MPKSVFITGAARGIGAAMAQTFAAAGYQIGIHYHTSSAMAQTLAHQLRAKGHTAFLFQADIADSRQVEEMLRDARITLGQIDVLINNAGIAQHALVTETSDEMWRRLFAVNCDGPFYACRAVLPHMIARGSGVILNVSSIWGQVGAAMECAYSAAKAALIGFTKALAKEVGPAGIRVNALAPGVIDTDMNAQLSAEDVASLCEKTPLSRLGAPQEIADCALFLAGEDASFLTGQIIGINGGFVI